MVIDSPAYPGSSYHNLPQSVKVITLSPDPSPGPWIDHSYEGDVAEIEGMDEGPIEGEIPSLLGLISNSSIETPTNAEPELVILE